MSALAPTHALHHHGGVARAEGRGEHGRRAGGCRDGSCNVVATAGELHRGGQAQLAPRRGYARCRMRPFSWESSLAHGVGDAQTLNKLFPAVCKAIPGVCDGVIEFICGSVA